MLLLTREEEKVAEARAEGRVIGIEEGIPIGEARGEERTKRLFIDRLMSRGMSYDEVIEMLGLKKE